MLLGLKKEHSENIQNFVLFSMQRNRSRCTGQETVTYLFALLNISPRKSEQIIQMKSRKGIKEQSILIWPQTHNRKHNMSADRKLLSLVITLDFYFLVSTSLPFNVMQSIIVHLHRCSVFEVRDVWPLSEITGIQNVYSKGEILFYV